MANTVTLVPRWTRWTAIIWVVYQLLHSFAPNSSFDPGSWPPIINVALLASLIGSLMVAQIYRYRRISNSIDRQKTKWVVFGFAAAIAALFITVLVGWLLALLRFGMPQVFYYLAGATVIYVSSLLLPLSIGVAIQRYRLWDIDVIIKRLV